jgi:predicted pyridoxine 5'-phosphate oxidase superfamily flavin-nucleotide-binding protein
MVRLTAEMKDALANALTERAFCIVGTASAEGWPNVSYRGSVAVLDDQTLTFWNRSRKETVKNIEQNGRCVVFYRNRERQANWRFFGMARIANAGDERERVWQNTPELERNTDPEKQGIGVFVAVERILDGAGNVVGDQ